MSAAVRPRGRWEVKGVGEVGMGGWGHKVSGTGLTRADGHAAPEGRTHFQLLVGVLVSLPETPLVNPPVGDPPLLSLKGASFYRLTDSDLKSKGAGREKLDHLMMTKLHRKKYTQNREINDNMEHFQFSS